MKTARPIRVEGDLAYVPLSRGLEAIIDADVVPLVSHKCWHARKSRSTFYAKTHYLDSNLVDQVVGIQYVVLGRKIGEGIIDHIDGDGLNNRRSNLRVSLNGENSRNVPMRVDNKSGFKGVYQRKGGRRWIAQIRLRGKNIALGSFETPEAAHQAYVNAAKKLHGDFAHDGFSPLKSPSPPKDQGHE